MMDGNTKQEILHRLNRIEGQVRGLKQMVQEERYCVDVLTQIASVHEALRGVGKVITRNHLATCVTDGLSRGDADTGDRIRQELLDIMYKLAR
jgi:DNA-binding FrmR family transcriptional regulator